MREVQRGVVGSLEATHGEDAHAIREIVAAYMLAAPLLFVNPSAPTSSGEVASDQDGWLRADGEWFWSSAGAKLFQSGVIDLEPEFMEHVAAKQIPPSHLTQEQINRAMQVLVEGRQERAAAV